jgi:uncharacterized protein YbaR (Trm112 family)
MIDAQLLALLADPNDPARGPLVLHGDFLVAEHARRAYPIRDGLPRLLPEDAIEGEAYSEVEHAGWRL